MDVGFVVSVLLGPAVMVVIAVVSWAAAGGRIARNRSVGLRLPSLLRSDLAWERGHRAAVRPAAVTAVALALLGVVAVVLHQDGVPEQPLTAVAVLLPLLAIVLIAVAANRAARSAGSRS